MRDLSNERVQTLRGFACLLLVCFHVVGHDASAGIGVPEDSWYRIFSNIFMHIRMPLFTFLSGFVYAYRPLSGFRSFAAKKAQRLLVPFVIVSTIVFLLQHAIGDAKHGWADMWQIYVLPYAHLWFLQAVMVLFAAVSVLDRFKALHTARRFSVVFGLVLAAHFFTETTDYLGMKEAMDVAPFFLLGIGLNRFRDQVSFNAKFAMAMGFAVLMTIHVMHTLDGHAAPKGSYFGTALSLLAVGALIHFAPTLKWLGWIGTYSFTIYLYHVFFSAGLRMALNKVGITHLDTQFVSGCAIAVCGPVLVQLALQQNSIACRLLLGQPGKSHAKNASTAVSAAPVISPSS